MFETINNILVAIDDFVWGVPLIVMILATGIFLTIRLRGLQFHKLILALMFLLLLLRSCKVHSVCVPWQAVPLVP